MVLLLYVYYYISMHAWKWWVMDLDASVRDLAGSKVALSTQLGTANS